MRMRDERPDPEFVVLIPPNRPDIEKSMLEILAPAEPPPETALVHGFLRKRSRKGSR